MLARFKLSSFVLALVFAAVLTAVTACSSPTASAPAAPQGSATPQSAATPPSSASPTVAPVQSGGAAPTTVAPAATTAPTTAPTAAPAPQSSVPATTAPTQAAVSNAPSGNPSDLIVNALRALSTHSVRVTTSVSDPAGSPPVVKSTFEFVPPDRMHMVSGNQDVTLIKGQGTWIKQNGKWVKSPVDLSTSMFGLFDPNNVNQLAADFAKNTTQTTPQFVGPDLLDGKPMFVYQYSSTIKGAGAGGADVQSVSKLWVGAVDGIPYKVEVTQDSTQNPGKKAQTIVTYTYDPNIKIETPQ